MNAPKVDDLDYINFLVAAQRTFSAVEAAAVSPHETAPAHDAYTRLLGRTPPDTAAVWREVEAFVTRTEGVLVIDDTTLDKPYARHMDLVSRHWSGKHHRVVQGINLVSLVWTDGRWRLPCDFRLYDKAHDGLSKNDHFTQMLKTAHMRGFAPTLVAFDSWYSALDNLKQVRGYGWDWLTQLKTNRQVSLSAGHLQAVSAVALERSGQVVHLKGYGPIKVFRTVDPHGNAEHWATSRLTMTLNEVAAGALQAWQIEVYQRSVKQFTGIERAQVRRAVAQRAHIGLAIRAFVRLEVARVCQQIAYAQAKAGIIRAALRAYLTHPTFLLSPTA